MQVLLLILGYALVIVITSVLSYRLGKGDGYLDHMEEIIEEREKALQSAAPNQES